MAPGAWGLVKPHEQQSIHVSFLLSVLWFKTRFILYSTAVIVSFRLDEEMEIVLLNSYTMAEDVIPLALISTSLL
jgi:hypothetical protein